MNWTPDRRPIRAIRCWAGIYDARDLDTTVYTDFGLTPKWRNRGVTWLVEELERMWCAGYKRFLIYNPAGMERRVECEGQPKLRFPSAQLQTLDRDHPLRRSGESKLTGISTSSGSVIRDLSEMIPPWLECHPEAEIYFYTGFRIKSAFNRYIPYDNTPEGEDAIPNLGLSEHREIIYANTQGFLDLTPDPDSPKVYLGFDKSATPEDRPAMREVVNHFRNKNIKVIGEAIPVNRRSGVSEIDLNYIDLCPWLAMSEAHFQRDPDGIWDFNRPEFCGERCEVGVGLTKNSILHQVAKTRYGSRFEALIDDFHSRGCVFYSFAPAERITDWERYILDIT